MSPGRVPHAVDVRAVEAERLAAGELDAGEPVAVRAAARCAPRPRCRARRGRRRPSRHGRGTPCRPPASSRSRRPRCRACARAACRCARPSRSRRASPGRRPSPPLPPPGRTLRSSASGPRAGPPPGRRSRRWGSGSRAAPQIPREWWSESFHQSSLRNRRPSSTVKSSMGEGDHRSARPRRPTIRQLAEHTGLSPAAVSYALRGLQVSAGDAGARAGRGRGARLPHRSDRARAARRGDRERGHGGRQPRRSVPAGARGRRAAPPAGRRAGSC